jgi:large subunit ribosomal protein L10
VNREEKTAAVALLHDRFKQATVTLLASAKGLSVAKTQQLRRALKQAGGEYKVAKNTFARRALQDTAYSRLEELLQGPTGLVLGYSDPVAVAKVLLRFAEESNDTLTIKGGGLEGQTLVAAQVKALATMASIGELRARIVAMARSPGSRIVAATRHPGARIAGAIAALIERKKEEESGAAAPASE